MAENDPINILLVDDDEDCLMFIRDAMEGGNIGNPVYAVTSGEEALDFLYRPGAYSNAPDIGLVYLNIRSSRGPFAVVDLSDIVRAVAAEFADDLRAKGIDLSFTSEWPRIRCEEGRIREAVRGLVDNAVRYIGAGDGKRIELGWSENDTHHVLWVRDNGPGIAPRDCEKVFHLFRRTKHVPYREERKGVGRD